MVVATNAFENPDRTAQVAPNSVATEAATSSEWTMSFMDRLSKEDRLALTGKACREWYAANSVLFREGDIGDAVYIIQSGRVAVLKEMDEGRATLLGYRGPGEIVGEMSLVGQQPRFASVVADGDTNLLRIDAVDFPSLMDRHPGIRWAVLNVLNDRLYAADIARTSILQEERDLAQRLERMTGEAKRLAELAKVRQETIELVAHDLRTPLAVIDGCLQMLQASLPDEARISSAEVLQLAQRSSGRLMSLVQELLEAARGTEPSMAFAREPLDVAQLLRMAVENVQTTAEQADIHLTLNVPPGLPQPPADVSQLERVVANLLDNALSYTPSGGSVTVAAQAKDEEVLISVTDTGPGVPTEHRDLIFERFTRVPGLKGRRRGFGLGLYFCRQVMQSHGGRIWVEPGPENVGSHFALALPNPNEMEPIR
jgi:signal transduction histidine kinase